MPSRRDSGLTLLEMLVVLVVIGVTATAAMLGIGMVNRGPTLQAEANRLAERLRLATDDGLVTGRPLAIAWTERDYAFLGWDEKKSQWAPVTALDLAERRTLPGRLRLSGSGPSLVSLQPDKPFELAMVDGATAWRIAFDGLNVSVSPTQ